MTVAVATPAGEHKVTRSTSTRKNQEPILRAVGYLWDATSAMAGPRLHRQAIEPVQSGGDVEVADLVLLPAGVANARHPEWVIGWSGLQDVQVDGQEIVLCGADGTKP